MAVLPVASMILAPLGMTTCPAGPIATIPLFSATRSPFSMTSSPFIEMIRALRIAIWPFGISLGAVSVTTSTLGFNSVTLVDAKASVRLNL